MPSKNAEQTAGKRPEPTAEELEFIYERVPHLSDKDIVADIQDETGFPPRSTGFIKRRRREFEAAKKVIARMSEGHSLVDIHEQRRRHWTLLGERAERIMQHLSTYFPYIDNYFVIELVVDADDYEAGSLISDERALCLLTHLKNEYPQLSCLRNWEDLPINQIGALDLIAILTKASEERVFKGQCGICENWQSEV